MAASKEKAHAVGSKKASGSQAGGNLPNTSSIAAFTTKCVTCLYLKSGVPEPEE